MNNPQSPEQWQQAVDAAHAVAMIEAAKRLGFISGGPVVNLERCAEILERGTKLGFTADRLAVYEYLNESAAPVEIHEAIVKIEAMADGGLLAAALLGTPMQGYAIEEFYRPLGDAFSQPKEPNG